MNDGDNDESPSVRRFVARQNRLRQIAEAIAVLGFTPKLEAELAECRVDQIRTHGHDFVLNERLKEMT